MTDEPPRLTTSQWLIARMQSLEARVTELEQRFVPALPTRSRPLPQDWEPKVPDLIWIKEKYPDVDEATERQAFRDYYGSRDENRRDWDAAFRNWIRKSVEFAKGAGARRHGGPPSRAASIDQINRERGASLSSKLSKARDDEA